MPRGNHNMRGGRRFPPKRVIFVGCEGDSERALVVLLQRYCDDAGHDVHLKTWLGSGGDSLAVVDGMVRHLRRVPFKREIETKLVLLDEDRMASDRKSGRDARTSARRADIDPVVLLPNSEGLLLRLHPGHEQRRVPANETERELRKLWPDYKKPPNANDLQKRFSMDDLRRAARYDPQLERLLATVGLVPNRQRS